MSYWRVPDVDLCLISHHILCLYTITKWTDCPSDYSLHLSGGYLSYLQLIILRLLDGKIFYSKLPLAGRGLFISDRHLTYSFPINRASFWVVRNRDERSAAAWVIETIRCFIELSVFAVRDDGSVDKKTLSVSGCKLWGKLC